MQCGKILVGIGGVQDCSGKVSFLFGELEFEICLELLHILTADRYFRFAISS